MLGVIALLMVYEFDNSNCPVQRCCCTHVLAGASQLDTRIVMNS